MERLMTESVDWGFNIPKETVEENGDIITCDDYCKMIDGDCNECPIQKAFDKLATYEKLQEQGLLITLPCKVGDTVYYECPYSTCVIGVQAYQITNVMISQNKKGEWTKKYRAMRLLDGKTIDSQINFAFDELGKTVFLTKEEAKAKLKELENE